MSDISIAMGLMSVLTIAFIALMRAVLSHANTHKLVNICIALLLTYFVFKYFKQLNWIPSVSTAFQKTLATSSAVVAALLVFKISLDVWKRLHLALIVGGLIFILFPFLLANTHAPTVYWPSPSFQAPTLKPPELPTQNTIVLLLDELSANAAKPVVEQLKDAGLNVTSTSIDPAGKNTLNVIPAIWTRSNFDQSAPCGPTQLCSASHVLDFAKVKASSDNIDIVGFYHRYCSIQGLRSCTFSPFFTGSAVTELVCSFPGLSKINFLKCDESAPSRSSFIGLRDNMQNTLLKAPFWKKGGVLYAHLLEPHPLMGVPLKPLQEEYKDNIAHASALVKLLTDKAKLVFGDDFKIIVFSDHPLRSEIWCADKTYIKMGCKDSTLQLSSQVPLIIATPSANKKPEPKLQSNHNIFDLLY